MAPSTANPEPISQRIPGVAVAIVQKGKVVKSQGYGYANVEHAVPVTAETMFQSGSVCKQFTSALVMMLVEDGQVALDASVRDYLTDAPESWQAIKIRHLLTHTSGIPDYLAGTIDERLTTPRTSSRRLPTRCRSSFRRDRGGITATQVTCSSASSYTRPRASSTAICCASACSDRSG